MSRIPLLIYYIAYFLFDKNIPVIPKCFVIFIRLIFSCYIGLGAKIGKNVTLGYGGLGVVIHHRAVIGDNVSIGAGVTVGGRSGIYDVPVLEDNVLVGSGAKIIGPVTIGKGARIGANAVVLNDIPGGVSAVGIPAQVIERDK